MNETEVKILFGKKVKQYRKLLNITQFTLGEMANINQRQIALIECGKSFPSLKTLIKFSQIFSCELSDLLIFDNLKTKEDMTKELNQIVDKYSLEQIRAIYTIAKELI